MNKTIAQIVASDLRTAIIFNKYGIDFCCSGNRTIYEVCKIIDINSSIVYREIDELSNIGAVKYFNTMELDALIEHIINTHHVFVKKSIPAIKELSNKVIEVHSQLSPETIEINNAFNELAIDLYSHLEKEEKILFPYIIENLNNTPNSYRSLHNPINRMEEEHEFAGKQLKKIARMSNNYTPPGHACNTYRTFYYLLEEFQNDLHIHIHLENNILFPKAKNL